MLFKKVQEVKLQRQLKYDKRSSEKKQTKEIVKKSSAEWNTVQEYLSDDLSSDSKDNKKLKAAETRARRKQKLKV